MSYIVIVDSLLRINILYIGATCIVILHRKILSHTFETTTLVVRDLDILHYTHQHRHVASRHHCRSGFTIADPRRC